ncbi:hypothetical protein [Lacunimicrobium album]
MAIQLSPELEARVQKIMDTGNYESVDEVLNTALDNLYEELPIDLSNPDVIAKLKAMVAVADEDLAAGRYEEFDAEKLKKEMRDFLRDEGVPAE